VLDRLPDVVAAQGPRQIAARKGSCGHRRRPSRPLSLWPSRPSFV
jgi:hypothetical protein